MDSGPVDRGSACAKAAGGKRRRLIVSTLGHDRVRKVSSAYYSCSQCAIVRIATHSSTPDVTPTPKASRLPCARVREVTAEGAPWGGKHAGQTHRIPMTYMDNGKQYIVAALKADGGNG